MQTIAMQQAAETLQLSANLVAYPPPSRVIHLSDAVSACVGQTIRCMGHKMQLTKRQLDVARLVAKGRPRVDIAQELAISVSTVDKLVRALKDRFDITTQAELTLCCANYLAHPQSWDREPTTGVLKRQRKAPAGQDAQANGSFADTADFDALFALLQQRLAQYGVTHVSYSHITRGRVDGSIVHLATRWSFPKDLTFDFAIPPEENLAFKHAMVSWDSVPMDLEQMAGSDLYQYVPENIRAQNDRFIKAGLVRGMTSVLPGLNTQDRLVLSVILQNAPRAVFDTFLAQSVDAVGAVLMQFRHAHLALAHHRTQLSDKEKAVLDHYADGQGPDQIAETLGISRRAVERIMHDVRVAYHAPTNAAAVACCVRERYCPSLPF